MGKGRPGITFQTSPPDLRDKLPRMDVAAFVGFAAAGPLHTPVAVEDEVRFREIFGPDLELAWDEKAGGVHRAHLGPAVRAFFQNGGRRCWVIRVAGDTAASNRFRVPGLLRLPAAGGYARRAAILQARSEGAWSDNLRVGTSLQRTALGEAGYKVVGGTVYVEISKAARATIAAGDLLRLTFKAQRRVLYLLAETVTEYGAGQVLAKPVWRVSGREAWFALTDPAAGSDGKVDVGVLGDGPTAPATVEAHWQAGAAEHEIFFAAKDAPAPGALLEVKTAGGSIMLLSVRETRPASRQEAPDLGPGQEIAAVGRDPLWPLTPAQGRAGIAGNPAAEKLSFDLWVDDGAGQTTRLPDLGFARPHPRFLGELPTDLQLYRPTDDVSLTPDGPQPGLTLWTAAAEPRFPLAAEGDGGDIYLPVGMEFLLNREAFAAALPQAAGAQVRNGLGAFSPSLFLDPDLAGYGVGALEQAVFHKRYMMGQPLLGLHAVWPLEEVTLLAVPDAIHTGWEQVTPAAPTVLTAPQIRPPSPRAKPGTYRVRWARVPGATGYIMQEAVDMEFTRVLRTYETEGPSALISVAEECPQVRYFRVRARSTGELGPWSDTERAELPLTTFTDCHQDVLAAPRMRQPVALGSGRWSLRWTVVGPEPEEYLLQESSDPDFFGARDAYFGTETNAETLRVTPQVTYYRVRSRRGDEWSPWSKTVLIITLPVTSSWRVKAAGADPTIIHQAALRLCAARGDVLTLLTLPAGHREQESAGYARALTSLLGAEDERMLTYGAIYHPWIVVAEESGQNRLTPPDGAVAGLMAARAVNRGAWIAPANQPLQGVLALQPRLGDSAWEVLAEAQINQMLADPRGFLLLSADTLSLEDDLRPINVRRLMILLRRLALREGAALVFEPNNDAFRRLVRRRFEAILSDLFVRGAFAGDTPEQSFQVVTGPEVNTPQSVDAGRFICELRVAPSQPLAFLTVRLVQAQGGGPAATEV